MSCGLKPREGILPSCDGFIRSGGYYQSYLASLSAADFNKDVPDTGQSDLSLDPLLPQLSDHIIFGKFLHFSNPPLPHLSDEDDRDHED